MNTNQDVIIAEPSGIVPARRVVSSNLSPETVAAFPCLFRELYWWEKLPLPHYVKWNKDGSVRRVVKWDENTNSRYNMYLEGSDDPYCPGGWPDSSLNFSPHSVET